jgi:hypothetical protein
MAVTRINSHVTLPTATLTSIRQHDTLHQRIQQQSLKLNNIVNNAKSKLDLLLDKCKQGY